MCYTLFRNSSNEVRLIALKKYKRFQGVVDILVTAMQDDINTRLEATRGVEDARGRVDVWNGKDIGRLALEPALRNIDQLTYFDKEIDQKELHAIAERLITEFVSQSPIEE